MSLSGGYRINVQTRVDDKICSFGIAYECVSGSDPLTDTTDLCDGWATTLNASYRAILSSDTTFEGLYAYALLPGVALPNPRPGASAPGDRAAGALPANSCAVITLQTNNPGARRQGRIYVSGISKADVTNGLFAAAFVAGPLTTFANNIVPGFIQAGKTFEPRIVQRVVMGVPIAGNMYDVNSTRVTNIPYTQRRRTTRQLGFML